MDTTTVPPARLTPRTGGTVRITVLDHGQLMTYLGDMRAIAVATFTAPPWNETRAKAALAAACLIADSLDDGYLAVLASIDDQPCGFAYGVNARRLEHLATRGTSTYSSTVPFELRELAVDPGYRGLGVGAGLHDALITARPRTPRYLTTHPAARSALGLYRSRGWRSTILINKPGHGPRILMHRPS